MIRIAITGPESTGKSWLTEQLAQAFNTTFIPEYARKYIEQLNRPYDFNDIEIIAAIGRFGPYIQYNKAFYSLAKTDDPLTVTIDRAVEIMAEKKKKDAEKICLAPCSYPFMAVLYSLNEMSAPFCPQAPPHHGRRLPFCRPSTFSRHRSIDTFQ